MTDQVNTEAATEETQAPQQPSFTPDDLVNAVIFLDEAAEQGAFKGWDKQQKALHARQRLVMFAQHWQATLEEASKQALAKAEGEAAPAATEGGE